MLSKFTLISVVSMMVFATACTSSSGGGGGTPNNGQGTIVAPSSIDQRDYRDVHGQLFGTWSSDVFTVRHDRGEELQQVIQLYFKTDATVIRTTCSRRGQVFADLAGIVNSTIAANNLSFSQSLSLVQGDCQFSVNSQTVQFAITSENGRDNVALGSGAEELDFHRNTPPGGDRDHGGDGRDHQGDGGGNQPQQPGFNQGTVITVFSGPNCRGISLTLDNDRNCSQQLHMNVRSVSFNGQCQDLQRDVSPDQFCQDNQPPR